MKTLFTLILIICTLINICAQWDEQISETTAHLLSVDFVNNDIGWIAGTSLVIKGTTNSGQTWENTGTTHAYGIGAFYSICFPTVEQGYACGYLRVNDYNMRNWARTENGGETWSWPTRWGFPAGYLKDVFFINDSIGWRVDSHGAVDKISSGMNGFSLSNEAYLNTALNSIHFINEDIGWVAGSQGYIAKSTDGGNQWNELVSGITEYLQSIFFINSNIGWAVGHKDDIGVIIKTSNGGDTWYQVNSPATMSIHQIQFVNESIGWACGSKVVDLEERGVILYTNDGGENWSEQYVCNRLSSLSSLFFINELTGWIVGYDGIILKTTNAGGTAVGLNENSFNKHSLSNNYPNPFFSETLIRYSIPIKGKVELKIYDLSGKEIATLVNEEKMPGTYEVTFNASLLNVGGVYIYKISAGDFIQHRKMIFLK